MKMKFPPLINRGILFFGALFCSSTSHAAQIVLNATLDQTEVVNAAPDSYRSRIYATTGDGLVQNFSSIGESTITYNLTAPAGQYFELSTDASWTDLEFEIRYQNGGIGQGPGQFRNDSPTITFTPFGGGGVFNPASYNLDFISISGPGGNLNRGWIRGTPTAGATYRFSQVSISSVVPAGYGVNIATGFGSAYIEITASSPDFIGGAPASFASLQAVPEPSTSMLMLFLGLGLFRRRR